MVTGVIAMTHAFHVALGWAHRPRRPRRLLAPHGAPRPLAGRARAAGAAPVELTPADGARTRPTSDRAAPAQPAGPTSCSSWCSSPSASSRTRASRPRRCTSTTPTRPSSSATSSATSASACRARCRTTSTPTDGRASTFTVAFNGVEVAGRARRRPARAVRARHPGRARGPLGRRRVDVLPSDQILVKHDEQYEADNGDRIADAEDGQTGDTPAP